MYVTDIRAEPNDYGGQIDLFWKNPSKDEFPDFSGVKIVRKERRYPDISPPAYDGDTGDFIYDGTLVQDATEGKESFSDTGLKSETLYYYTFYTYDKNVDPLKIQHFSNRTSRIAALATSAYGSGDELYNLIPNIYKRYDKNTELKRFLEIFGHQLDRIRSYISGSTTFYDLDKCDGALLPLLAQWIGWDLNLSLDLNSQRNEIREAPELYKTIGLIANLRAFVTRITSWNNRAKEFVHNVCVTNEPEKFNIWSKMLFNKNWSETELVSLDYAYEGRAACIKKDDKYWLFYHTLRNDQWDICYKTLIIFSIGSELIKDLDSKDLSNLTHKSFKESGHQLSAKTVVTKKNSQWIIHDKTNHKTYNVRKEREVLNVYHWTPSRPLSSRSGIDKYPAAVVHNDKLWVFWSVYNETDRMWHINYLTETGETWSPITADEPFSKAPGERKKPVAVSDDSGGMWLFWLERVGTRWQLKYNRHDGTSWQLNSPADLLKDEISFEDPFTLFYSDGATKRIYVFWATKLQNKWTIAYCYKQGLDPASDWSPMYIVPKEPSEAEYDDREPAAFVNNNKIELYRSSNKSGSWSIWHNSFTIINPAWAKLNKVTDGLYNQRCPLPMSTNNGIILIYGSNQSLSYSSGLYRSTETVDFRYAGATTVDTGNVGKKFIRGKFEDFQTYTYDAGMGKKDCYARDALGIFLLPDTYDKDINDKKLEQLINLLSQFMPIQVRPVFINEANIHKEEVHTSIKSIYRDMVNGENNSDSGWIYE